MAYDFVYTDELESVYKGKLASNLKVYESEVRKTLLGSRANYNILKNRYNNPSNETEDNSKLLATLNTEAPYVDELLNILFYPIRWVGNILIGIFLLKRNSIYWIPIILTLKNIQVVQLAP